MDTAVLKKGTLTVLSLFGLALMLGMLWMLSQTTQQATEFDRLHDWLLGMNIVGVALLLVLLGYNLFQLIAQYRARSPGSRLTARLVGVFALLSLIPVVLVFYFSLQFITRGIDSWFDVRIEQALEESLELSRASLEGRMRDQQLATEDAARALADIPPRALPPRLESLRRNMEASELTVYGSDGRILATSGEITRSLLPATPERELMSQARRTGSYIGLDSPEADDGEPLHVRALMAIPDRQRLAAPRVLQARFAVPERQSELAENVQSAWQQYRELAFYRTPIRISFVLTLSLVLLLSLLVATAGAFHFARRLVAPIQDLAAGTRAVARGEFETRVPLRAHDEVGFLAMSFNEMTRRLEEAREQTARSRREVEAERAYLEAVLARLTSGVLALDAGFRLRASNHAAEQILAIDLDKADGRTLMELAEESERLEALARRVQEHVLEGDGEWSEEIALPGRAGRRLLLCRTKALPFPGEQEPGYVIVFDDITTLVQAQRDAAWGEVARRLAHEIRNPLTPIQLAAERIRHKYMDEVEDNRALDRATHTIIQQVDSLKSMVKAFSDYARAPEIKLALVDVNQLIREVADLYRGRPERLRISQELEPELPEMEADADRLRQILHNLIRNSLEADGSSDKLTEVHLASRLDESGPEPLLEIRVEDDGPGFDTHILGEIFEPYVTSKPKGTGLGLAIVKKLVEEHGGQIEAENREPSGARIVIRLPVSLALRSRVMLEAGGKADAR